MLTEPLWIGVVDKISQTTAYPFNATGISPVGSSSFSQTFLLTGEQDRYFVKTSGENGLEMFSCEFEGLLELASPGVIGVPQPVCFDLIHHCSFLVMDYIESRQASRDDQKLLGQKLARLHQITKPEFGWQKNNFIGSTPQPNKWSRDWIDFFRSQRIGYQLALAAKNGGRDSMLSKGRQLLNQIDQLFENYQPQPSLLHGDLWNGNFLFDIKGNPYIFDPAVYYGDRETDLAMTELFGGFSPSFYSAYNSIMPLDRGYARRKPLYQLYHILNHGNLFGGGYFAQAESVIDRLHVTLRF